MRCALGLLAAIAVLGAPAGAAHANGRFPRSIKVVFQPGHPETAVLGMTFGALVTHDDGASWRWACESAIGFEGTYDPDYELSASGAIFATTYRGLRVNRDGCVWAPPAGAVGSTQVSAIAIDRDGAIWAGTSDATLGSAIYKSVDDGVTFTPTTLVGADGDWWSTIEAAPGDAQRLAVTGYRMAAGQPRERVIFRSRDGGGTWDELPTTAFTTTDASDLRLEAIAGDDPDLVFVRVTSAAATLTEALYRTADFGTSAVGGPTWTKVLEVNDRITGVVVRAGGEVVAATPSSGLFRSTDAGQTFAPIAGVMFDAWCLGERPGGQLWLCTNNLPPDGATLHVSTADAAGPWAPALTFAEIAGPLRCPAGTTQRADCEDLLWCGLKENLGITSTELACGAVDAGIDAASDGGGGKSCCSTGRGPGAEIALVALGLLLRRRRPGQRGRVSR